jgi:hypothetical protein
MCLLVLSGNRSPKRSKAAPTRLVAFAGGTAFAPMLGFQLVLS